MIHGYIYYFNNILQIFTYRTFNGWGEKKQVVLLFGVIRPLVVSLHY